MALGRRDGEQESLWVATAEMARSPGHPFYERLNAVLAAAGFDRFAEAQCAPYYAKKLGRRSIPPGVYFRMLFVGYFEGLDSQRAIAWRCADSLALRSFLGLGWTKRSPDHSSLTVIRQRLPLEVHQEVFRFVLGVLEDQGLLQGKTIAVDTSTLEANAAMRSIVRRDTGESWSEYVRRLAKEDGIENPTDEDARRLDRKRKKKVSNREWTSKTDGSARIMKMKDGRTHLGYKVSHAVDLDTDAVVAVQIHPGDVSDTSTLVDSACAAEHEIAAAGHEGAVVDVVGDKGFHSAEALSECAAQGFRTYIPEPKLKGRRRWMERPARHQLAVYANRRRVRGNRGRALQRLRSEMAERSFAHICETGGARRSWLRGFVQISKRYVVHAAARNLGLLMRVCFGVGTPRSLQAAAELLLDLGIYAAVCGILRSLARWLAGIGRAWAGTAIRFFGGPFAPATVTCSTGC
jgi:transposase